MKNLFSFLIIASTLFSCNDGDVIDVNLEFDDVDLNLCDNFTDSYVLYKTKTSPNESLSLIFPKGTANDSIFTTSQNKLTTTLTINNSTVAFNYRTYNNSPSAIFCQEIPDSSVSIIDDYSAAEGAEAIFYTTFVDDDNDGIPTETEGTTEDTDGDGILNYLDADDDGDNINTIDENPDPNDDGDFSDAQDTDADGIKDYLDNDDDNDGVLTILEDENGDRILSNDFDENSETPSIARYLDNSADDSFESPGLKNNTYQRTYSIKVTIEGANLNIINYDTFELGTYTKEPENIVTVFEN